MRSLFMKLELFFHYYLLCHPSPWVHSKALLTKWLMMFCSFLYAKPVYYGNDIYSALFIFSQRQAFALPQMLGVFSRPDAERKNAYRTKISVLPQKHPTEIKRKAQDNKQIPCSLYSFLNMTLKPQWGKTSWGKEQFFKPFFRSIVSRFNTDSILARLASHWNKIVFFLLPWKACNHLLNNFPCSWINLPVSNCSIHCADEQ